MMSLFRFVCFWVFVPALAVAQPIVTNFGSHIELQGGRYNIPDGAILEGSVGHGGWQPNYLIDLRADRLQGFLLKATEIGQMEDDFWTVISDVTELVNVTFPYVNYRNPYYLGILKRAREEGREVRLSEYHEQGAGVCREFALYTHFALKAAGISNEYVYARIHRASRTDDYDFDEDHAFVVVNHMGEEWVVDPYYWGFHGFRLADLFRRNGITSRSKAAPIASPGPGFRRIKRINPYPRMWIPVQKDHQDCNSLLSIAV